LQVFELAREARPYDEEFLLAALLHDVGKAIDPQAHAAAAVEALRGAVTERTLWLIAHRPEQPGPRARRVPSPTAASELTEAVAELDFLRDPDAAGRVAGATVGTIAQALDYIRGLERESYLEP